MKRAPAATDLRGRPRQVGRFIRVVPRGVSLQELLGVVALLALVFVGFAAYALPKFKQAHRSGHAAVSR